MAYDKRHGGAWDRGSADAYYGRPKDPHYFVGATYSTEKICQGDMRFLAGDLKAYNAGYNGTSDRKYS